MINYRFTLVVCAGLTLYLISVLFTPVHASCEPTGTTGDDVIICTGLDTLGVDAGDGDDRIHVEPDAEVAIDTGSNFQPVLELGTGRGDVQLEGSVTSRANDTAEGNDEGFIAETDISASSAARGIEGRGDLLLVEIGEVASLDVRSDVSAEADAAALGIPLVTGKADATANAHTSASGILAIDDLVIANRGVLLVRANGPGSGNEAEADAPSIGVDSNAESAADATSTAEAYGIVANGVSDARDSPTVIENTGLIDVQARSDSESDGPAIAAPVLLFLPPTSLFIDAVSTTSASSSAEAEGIRVSGGRSQITNSGNIIVMAASDAEADALADATNWYLLCLPLPCIPIPLPVNAISEATTEAEATARGLWTGPLGNGEDVVINKGKIEANAEAKAFANADSVLIGIAWDFDADATATANSTAIGIGTGGGNDKIVNEGSIVVHAEADGEAQARIEGLQVDVTLNLTATAMAIVTGDGNDIVVNKGFIEASVLCGSDCTSHVISINTGAGDDQVTLTEGSETHGIIAMHEGVDILMFDGPAIVTADLDAGTEIDTLVVQRSGEISTGILGFERIIKQQQGVFRIEDLPTADYLEVDEGVLTLGDSYAMASESDFRVRINPDGSENKLNIETGIASLDGDLHVVRSPGLFFDGDTFDIVTAPLIDGAFVSENLPEATPLLSFSVVQEPAVVEVVASANPFGSVAENRVEWAVGNYLDAIAPTATGDLSNVLAEFQQLPEPEFEAAFSSLSPDSYDNATLTSYRVARAYNRGIQQRLSTRRLLDMAGGNGKTHSQQHQVPVMLASNDAGDNLGGFLQGASNTGRESLYGLWLDTYGLWGDQDDRGRDNWTHGGYTGFDFNVYGITLGYDLLFTDQVVAGLSAGYAKTEIDLDNNAGDGDIDSMMVSMYGEYQGESAYLNAVLTYGKNDYDNKRNLRIETDRRTAHSDHDGTLFSAYLESGRPISREHWQLEPFISLQYIHLDEDSFRESGAGDVNMNIDDNRTESLVSEAGIRATHTAPKKSGKLITDMGVAWVHDFDIDDRVITTSYAGAPSTAFSVKGRDAERDGLALDLGLTFQNKHNLTTSVRLGAEIRDNYYDKGIRGQIRYEF